MRRPLRAIGHALDGRQLTPAAFDQRRSHESRQAHFGKLRLRDSLRKCCAEVRRGIVSLPGAVIATVAQIEWGTLIIGAALGAILSVALGLVVVSLLEDRVDRAVAT
jgi:hypothetical protein